MPADRTNPGSGNPLAISAAGLERLLHAAAIRQATTTVKVAATSASEHWRGVAKEAFETSVEEAVPELDMLADSLDATASALFTYARQVSDIKDEQEDLELRRARLEAQREELTLQRDIWSDLSFGVVGPLVDYSKTFDNELQDLEPHFAAFEEDWDELVRRRERVDADFIADLSSSDVRGRISALTSGYDCPTPAEMLFLLNGMSASDLSVLAAAHPELLDRLRHASPTEVNVWWASLGLSESGLATRALLIQNVPALIGSLGGVPADVRVEANRLLAEDRLAELDAQLDQAAARRDDEGRFSEYGLGSPVDPEQLRENEYQKVLTELSAERAYLERVVADGDPQLYLYQPDEGRIIEMYGDVDKANVVQTFMPGTNANLESLYTSTDGEGLSSLTRLMVSDPLEGANVAGFVVVQGRFPSLENLVTAGPHINPFAEVLGRRYAGFISELDVIAPDTPVMSVEHSFGSAVGGKAETVGATFDTRYLLAGIGMTEEWERNPGTDYFAAQGPMDVNRYLDGHQWGFLGYGITPSEVNGFDERPSGMSAMEPWQMFAPPLNEDLGIRGIFNQAIEQHNALTSPNESVNGTVVKDLRLQLQNLATQ